MGMSIPAVLLAVAIIFSHLTSVDGGTLSVLIKNGHVEDRDSDTLWISNDSDAVAFISVVGLSPWFNTPEDSGTNYPTWNTNIDFQGSNFPSYMVLEMMVKDIDDGFIGIGAGSDDLGSSKKQVSFDTCVEESTDVRFDNLRAPQFYVDTTVTYRPSNLCLTNNGGCGPESTSQCTCVRDKVVSCSCQPGYTRVNNNCVAINPCTRENGGCDTTSTECVYLEPGSRQCSCKSGYERSSPTACSAMDICLASPSICGANSICVSQGPGLYRCDCMEGYTSSSGSNCQAVNNCKASNYGGCNPETEVCVFTGPATNNCTCKPGHQQQATGETCTAIDPCQEQPTICGVHSTCVFTGPGTYQCHCMQGYASDNGVNCSAINPCQDHTAHLCGENSVCIFTSPGEHRCECMVNYTSTAEGRDCKPIDPCLVNNGGCGSSDCRFIGPNQRRCECLPGYQQQPDSTCREINPCAVNNGDCGDPTYARCIQLGPGQATCSCQRGYAGNPPMTPCTAVNPCDIEGICGENSTCTSGDNSTSIGFRYTCSCNPGYASLTGSNCSLAGDPLSAPSGGNNHMDDISVGAIWATAAAGVFCLLVLLVVVIFLVRRSHRHRLEENENVVSSVHFSEPVLPLSAQPPNAGTRFNPISFGVVGKKGAARVYHDDALSWDDGHYVVNSTEFPPHDLPPSDLPPPPPYEGLQQREFAEPPPVVPLPPIHDRLPHPTRPAPPPPRVPPPRPPPPRRHPHKDESQSRKG
eukprot:m.222847 g.222847  ORF g.222847 m.222847 type:complete len:750 (-) comp17026_c3_seq1:249-2498(-)